AMIGAEIVQEQKWIVFLGRAHPDCAMEIDTGAFHGGAALDDFANAAIWTHGNPHEPGWSMGSRGTNQTMIRLGMLSTNVSVKYLGCWSHALRCPEMLPKRKLPRATIAVANAKCEAEKARLVRCMRKTVCAALPIPDAICSVTKMAATP